MDVRRRLNRALLARQWLLAPRAVGPGTAGVVRAVEHLFGLQSQNPEPPYWALAARLAGFDPADLSAAVGRREVVRLALHRSTIHAVSAADAGPLRAYLAPWLERQAFTAWRGGLAGLDRAELAALTREALAAGPLAVGGIGETLARRWPDRDPAVLARAARSLVPLVQVPPRGIWGRTGPPVHLDLADWVPGSAQAPAMRPAEALVRYLAAFGPASLADAQKCLGVTGLRSAATALGDRLVPVAGEDGAELLDLAELAEDPDRSPDPDVPAPPVLLAPFDAAVLSHADRRRVLGDVPVTDVISSNGIVAGTVLLDGFVAGTWAPVRRADVVDVVLRPLRPWTPDEREGAERRAAALLDALHPGRAGTCRVSSAG